MQDKDFYLWMWEPRFRYWRGGG